MSSALKKTDTINMLYSCSQCNYHCLRRNDLNKHFETKKHARVVNQNSASPIETPAMPKSDPPACVVNDKPYNCLCGKVYRHSTSLYKHRRFCEYFQKHVSKLSEKSEPKPDAFVEMSRMLMTVIEQQSKQVDKQFEQQSKQVDKQFEQQDKQMTVIDQQGKQIDKHFDQQGKQVSEGYSVIEQQSKQLAEVVAKVDKGGVTNNVTNSGNFNLNVFLNSDCKDAMNVADFFQTIEVTSEDLDHLGEVGYVEGVTRLMLNSLRKLEVCQRPIHCTDVKRESFYIKDKDIWEKDNASGDKMHNVVKNVAHRNIVALPEWQKDNPLHNDFSTRTHEKYMRIVNAAFGGSTQDETNKFRKKIIRNAAPELVPPKNSEDDIV